MEIFMNTMGTNREEQLLFAVPMLPPDRKVPAAVQSIALVKKIGEPDVMRIVVKRDLAFEIESFTFRYRFSNLPIYASDVNHRFNSYVYNEDDINSSDKLTFNGALPSGINIEACSAYISEIKLTSGQVLTFEASEYRFILRPKKPQSPSAPEMSAGNKPQTQPSALSARPANSERTAPQNAPSSTPSSNKEIPVKKKHVRFTVILTAVIFTLVIEAIAFMFLSQYTGIKRSADMLMSDNRFNEAYKIVSQTNYNGLLQRVCEKATVYYISIGDLESAYVYAYGAPDPFTDTIIDYAAQSVVSISDGKINENAFRVAKMTADDAKFDQIISSMSDILTKNGDYPNALRVMSELRDDEAKPQKTDEVFRAALNHYISRNDYDALIAFIEEMSEDTTFKQSKEYILEVAQEECSKVGDHACILYLSNHYSDISKISSAQTVISSADKGVRTKFEILYPLLTASQKRAYHANAVTIWNSKPVLIEAGHINGTDIDDAVSVERNSKMLMVLHEDGSVTTHPDDSTAEKYDIPSFGDIVQIALGEEHAVLLHANGTLSAYGDNTYGQCDVAEWTDIAAVAVGQRFTVGLKLDGTLVAVGSNTNGQCDVSRYRNVVDIAACNQTTVILFSDGTVKLQGNRSFGLEEVEGLTDITDVCAASSVILSQRRDGKLYVHGGMLGGDYGSTNDWHGIVSYDVGSVGIVGVDKNGVVYTSGDGLPKS